MSMNHRVSQIRNLRTIKALRGDPLLIDLGITFAGQLTAWMKKDPNDSTYRSFDIIDNRYLSLTKDKTSDYCDILTGELTEAIEGKWYFDVEVQEEGLPPNTKTIYTGTIIFYNDITNSRGIEALTLDQFNIEGGGARTIYLASQIIDQGNSTNQI